MNEAVVAVEIYLFYDVWFYFMTRWILDVNLIILKNQVI